MQLARLEELHQLAEYFVHRVQLNVGEEIEGSIMDAGIPPRYLARVPDVCFAQLDEPPAPKLDDTDPRLDQPPEEPGEMTFRQRQQLQREERKQRRLDKQNERRLRRGLPPK